jgi:DNA-binding transcriptional MocR family regulator
MASPVTVALATRWINDGTGDALLAEVRRESAVRQVMACSILQGSTFRTDPAGFHLWLSLPPGWTRSAFVGHMRASGIGVVASDPFTTGDTPPEAVRVCLGGPIDREQMRGALEFMAHALAEKPSLASSFL